jgi:hypothetical protein
MSDIRVEISPEALAAMGGGEVAYVKQVRGIDLARLYPMAPPVAPDSVWFAVHAADGTPIVLADTPQAAVSTAWDQDLQPVAVH